MADLGLKGRELSLSLVSDAEIRTLNRIWRKKDVATDVLSFPAGAQVAGLPGPSQLGDVVISLDTAARQARDYARTLEEELDRYLAHGLLHLLGHDHHRTAEAREMGALEERLLGSPGMIPVATRRAKGKRKSSGPSR
jgi:probable rRNA maturation factor